MEKVSWLLSLLGLGLIATQLPVLVLVYVAAVIVLLLGGVFMVWRVHRSGDE